MDYEPFSKKRRETIANISFDEQIIFLSSASLPDFIEGVCEVLHERPVADVKEGAFREVSLPGYKDRSGNTVNETLRAHLAHTGYLELTSYRAVRTVVNQELEVTWTALTQRAVGVPVWELRQVDDGAEIFSEEIELSEQEQLNFRAKFIEALTRREVQKNKVRIETARVASKYL